MRKIYLWKFYIGNHFENLNKNNFDDGNIDKYIDVNNLSPEMDNKHKKMYLILLLLLRK